MWNILVPVCYPIFYHPNIVFIFIAAACKGKKLVVIGTSFIGTLVTYSWAYVKRSYFEFQTPFKLSLILLEF